MRRFFGFFLSPKGHPFKVFDILQQTDFLKSPFQVFRHYGAQKSHFREYISMSPKCPPSIFFIFCNKLDFRRTERVPPFTILNNELLSLSYSADFTRSRLVHSYPKDCLSYELVQLEDVLPSVLKLNTLLQDLGFLRV